jgi:hypothetical protein
MDKRLNRTRYKGFRTAGGWEIVVEKPGQPVRLLDVPQRGGEWALSILSDYLGNEDRARDLHEEFGALTIRRFTKDWELSGNDIEDALLEVEILRARWRIALMRG